MPAPDPLPTVSVVIPVYNGAAFLAGAVACVRAQTHAPRQIIVVDDGSGDHTAQVARTLGAGVDFVSQENRGPAAARNRGLEFATSEFVAFLDVDDLWPADTLAEQLQGFAGRPGTDIVLGQTQALVESGGEAKFLQAAPDDPTALPHLPLIGAALFRRSVFDKVGRFDARKRFSEDVDWFIRARESQAGIRLLPQRVLIKRCHTANMTRGKSLADFGLAAVVRASLDRRRKAGEAAQPVPAPPPT